MKPDETAFEAEIEAWLLDHGYAKGDPRSFDRALGLDPGELLAFVAATQPDAWARLIQLHGGEEAARSGLLKRVAAELDERGTVDVLRHGVKDLGVDVRLDVLQAGARARAGARRRLRREPALGRAAAAATTTRRTRSTWRCS